jgi:aspartate/methionine/tyrosine aminotransferase
MMGTVSTPPSFSLVRDNPFVVASILRQHAPRDAIDLSRGDPGLGFAPSVAGRECAAALLSLDAVFNGARRRVPSSIEEAEKEIALLYREEHAGGISRQIRSLVSAVKDAAQGEGKTWDDASILERIFHRSAMAGGSYLDPLGEELTRVVVAALHRQETGIPYTSSDVILMAGASHAMAMLFKLFAGTGFLRKGDRIAMLSPSYWPDRGFADELQLSVLSLGMDIASGELRGEDLSVLESGQEGMTVLFLIDPHNPTGFKLSDGALSRLAALARKRDIIVVSEELYFPFVPSARSIVSLIPERTIRVHARSKSERSAGLRFGEVVMTRDARMLLAEKLRLAGEGGLLEVIRNAKAPGFMGGEFQHTTFVPGPSQFLGIAHLILGAEDRRRFVEDVAENRRMFLDALELPHAAGTYYVIFDLLSVGDGGGKDPEALLLALAEAGVVYLPALKFFAAKDSAPPTLVRASVANANTQLVLEAASITKRVLRRHSEHLTPRCLATNA